MISHWRQTFREQYAWLLLPVFLVVAFTLDNRTGVANVMRVLCFPLVLFALSARDYRAIWANPAARAFWLLIAWLNITLLWDGLSETDWDFFQRNVYLFTLMGMVYLVAAYQPGRQGVVFYAWLLAGFAGALLIFADWPGTPGMIAQALQAQGDADWWNRFDYYTRGIFTLSHYTGWMMGVLFIAAVHAAGNQQDWRVVGLYLVAGCFLAVVVFAQLRGIWVGMVVALAVLVALKPRRGPMLAGIAVLAVALIAAVLVLPGLEAVIRDSIQRGDSFRFAIWQAAAGRFAGNPLHLLFGFGLSAPNGIAEHSHLHSLYINTLHYGGVIALGLYAWLLWLLACRLRPFAANSLPVVLLLCMQVAFLVDGEYLMVAPSAMMLAYLLPLMWAMFQNIPEAGFGIRQGRASPASVLGTGLLQKASTPPSPGVNPNPQ